VTGRKRSTPPFLPTGFFAETCGIHATIISYDPWFLLMDGRRALNQSVIAVAHLQ
jgi:hypothetical protein